MLSLTHAVKGAQSCVLGTPCPAWLRREPMYITLEESFNLSAPE